MWVSGKWYRIGKGCPDMGKETVNYRIQYYWWIRMERSSYYEKEKEKAADHRSNYRRHSCFCHGYHSDSDFLPVIRLRMLCVRFPFNCLLFAWLPVSWKDRSNVYSDIWAIILAVMYAVILTDRNEGGNTWSNVCSDNWRFSCTVNFYAFMWEPIIMHNCTYYMDVLIPSVDSGCGYDRQRGPG